MAEEAVKQEEVVSAEPPQEPEKPSYSEEETRAMQDGWRPLDKWTDSGNDAKDHRSAREFNDRGELLRKISDQNKYIQKVTQGIESLKQHNQRVYESAYTKALQDLKVQHAAAVEAGDANKADKIVDQIADTKVALASQRAQPVAQPDQGPNPALVEWRKKNSWYDQDEDMRVFADAVGFKFVNSRNGIVEPDEVLAHVEKKVKDRFMKEEPKKIAAPDPVGGVQKSSKSNVASHGLKESDLDEVEIKAMRNYVDFKLGTKADYLAELAKIR